MKLALPILAVLQTETSATAMKYSGVKQLEQSMPLRNIKAYNRKDKLSLHYWTQLVESRECLRQPFDCNLSEFDQYLEGEYVLTNVPNMQNWLTRPSLILNMKLAFIDKSDAEFPIYDVLDF